MVNAPELPDAVSPEAPSTTNGEYVSPQPPRGRSKEFLFRWRAYARLMYDTGVLSEEFMPSLEMLCDAHDQIILADVELKKEGSQYIVSEKGTVMAHPACVRRESAKADVLKYQKELCLTPTTCHRRPTLKKAAKVETAQR